MSNPLSVNRKAKLQIRLQCPQRKPGSTILCQAVYNIFTQEISLSNLFMCIKRWGERKSYIKYDLDQGVSFFCTYQENIVRSPDIYKE